MKELVSELKRRNFLSMKIDPLYDFLREDPRFVELLEKVGLSE